MIATALIMGFAGSFHCIGMCSPLAMAVTGMNARAWFNRIVYNAGRILTYGFLGAFISSGALAFSFSKYQALFSVTLGVLLMMGGVIEVGKLRLPWVSDALLGINRTIKNSFQQLLSKRTLTSVALMGSLNGLLPCGLTLVALTFCLSLAGPIEGFQFMLLFGMGTLPAMIGFGSLVNGIIRRFNFNGKAVMTGLIIFSGFLLVLRSFLMHVPPQARQNVVDIVLCR